jgi:membrane fusion protein, multidrug efflux system
MSIKNSLYALIFSLLLGLSACGSNNQSAPYGGGPVAVSVQQVTTSQAAYYDEYPAIVKALNEVELRPQVGGYITGIHFKEGSKVKKGQKLYTIDQQQSEAAYQQAMANMSLQEANLNRAKKDVERYRELDQHEAIAKQQLDYAEAAYSTAQQQVAAAKAAVRSVQTNVRYTTIKAPFDGTIGISQVRLGASVSPGQTLLNTISSDNPMAVDIVIDQREILRFIEVLNAKGSMKNDSTFRLKISNQLYPEQGKISFLDRAVDPQTGTIKMRIVFPNPDFTLRAGMSGTLLVLSNASEKSIVIPHKAVNEQLGEFFVYLLDSARATQRKVQLGAQVGRNVIVKDGLQVGETVITEGLQNLREGTPVSVSSPEANK